MDINLTGQVAANLIQNPIMIMSASAIGGLIAGSLTLLGVWITQKHATEREEINRKEEAQKAIIEKRTLAYTDLISILFYFRNQIACNKNLSDKDLRDIYKFMAEVKLLGSPKIDNELLNLDPHIFTDIEKLKLFSNKMIPLMRKELQGQGFEVSNEAKSSIPEQ